MTLLKEVVQSYTYVVMWMCVSIAVIMFNKWLLAFYGFPFPIALTLWHMLCCTIVGVFCVRVLKLVKSHNMTFQEWYQRVLPIGILYAGSLWLSNSAYLYLSVSFIQMTKSLMPGLVYACGCFLGTEKFSRGASSNMILIAFGVLVCALGEVNLVFKGLVQQLVALVLEALRLTMIQILINSKGQAMNSIQSLYYISPACFISLAVPFVAIELPKMQSNTTWVLNWNVLISNALAALALNLAVFMLIGKTSALTMNIAGVIKDWMLIYFSYYVFHAPLTRLNLFGYIFCCSGVVIYQKMKLDAMRKKHAQDKAIANEEEGQKLRQKEQEQPLKETKLDDGMITVTAVQNSSSNDDKILAYRGRNIQ